jgi:hypothetical protein
VCIFAYGQTGSGKTHTMSGTDIGQYSGRGINYRALDDLFELNRQRTAEVSGWVGWVGGWVGGYAYVSRGVLVVDASAER